MTVESRKRSYDEIEYNQDDDKEFEIEGSDEDLDVDNFLTQKVDFAKSSRAKHYMKMSQMQQTSTQADPTKVAGVIRRVSLRNFMCHENFVLEFGPRLNFIIGHNGSGKSAILTGISICLGAKAAETNRGSSLKDLIREGANSANIQVVLANEGPDAYEPGKYGSEIIIERSIRRDGASTYILKSENGKKVSNKKQDIDIILDYHNIAVNNPMAFLSQDAARSFLTASTDEQKYKFFMKGTLMDEIHQNIKAVKDHVDNMGLRIIRMKEALITLKDEAREAKRLHERLRSSEELRQRQRILHGKYFWMQAEKAQAVIEQVRQSRNDMEETIRQLEEMIFDYEAKITDADAEKEQLLLKSKKAEEISKAEMDRFASKKKELQNVSAKIDSVVMRLKEVETNIKENEKRITIFDKEIQREEERIRQINGGSLEALRNELAVLEERSHAIEREKEAVTESADSVDARNKEIYNDLQAQADDKRQIIQNLQKYINTLKSNKNDELAAYPDRVKAAVQDMARTNFQAPVLGPVGRYLSLKPEFEKWGPVLEQHLGQHLNTFIVENFNDQRTLKSIFRKNNLYSNIIIRKPEKFDYSSGLPSSQYTSILDVLNFSNENIKYGLIDMAHVESVILVEDRVEAQRILESHAHNVVQVISLNDRHSGQRSSMNKNGGFRVDPIYYDNNIPKLAQKNKVQDVRAFEVRLRGEQTELQNLDTQKSQISQNVRAEKSHLSARRKNLDAEARRIQAQIYQINSKLQDNADTGKLEGYIEEKNASQKENETYKNTIGEIHQELEILKQKLQLKVQESDDIKAMARKAHLDFDAIKRKILDVDAEKELNINKRQHFEQTKQKRIQDFKAMEQNLPAWEKNREENIAQAQESCQKEEADSIHLNSIDEVKVEIEKVTRRVERENENLGKTPEEIINEDEAARNKYVDAKKQFDDAVSNRRLFHSSLNDRLKAFRESRSATFFEADLDFKLSLQFRNFSGNLNFDVDKSKLTMYVSTKNDKKPRHVDSLSGGEKSFSQISLLLATWKPMRSRIKGLDEFDVFMDQVNRKIGMRLMLDKLSKEHSQTIFITPQDIGQIAELDKKYVRIHRIKDPRAAH